ncbi:hypothetical protein ACKWTF_000605 [Chironomus riparius]
MKITSQRTKNKEHLMKCYFFVCFIGMWLITFQFGISLIVEIHNLQLVAKILPNITVFPYNSSKTTLFFTKRKEILDILDKLKISFPSTQVEQQKCNLQRRSVMGPTE